MGITRGRDPIRVDGLPDDSRQNQYMAHATNIAKRVRRINVHEPLKLTVRAGSGAGGDFAAIFDRNGK
jgi:hypothetical protein